MLSKIFAIILSTLLLASAQTVTAQAGCGGKGAGHGFQQASLKKMQARKAAQARAAAANRKQSVAARKAKAPEVAAAETTSVAEEVAETTETTDTKQTVAAVEQTCTKFIAETGTTISVACAN